MSNLPVLPENLMLLFPSRYLSTLGIPLNVCQSRSPQAEAGNLEVLSCHSQGLPEGACHGTCTGEGWSTWLISLPLEDYGFSLHKGAFRDAMALRCGWLPSNAPTSCACGTHFTVEHALSCPKGGFPSITTRSMTL